MSKVISLAEYREKKATKLVLPADEVGMDLKNADSDVLDIIDRDSEDDFDKSILKNLISKVPCLADTVYIHNRRKDGLFKVTDQRGREITDEFMNIKDFEDLKKQMSIPDEYDMSAYLLCSLSYLNPKRIVLKTGQVDNTTMSCMREIFDEVGYK